MKCSCYQRILLLFVAGLFIGLRRLTKSNRESSFSKLSLLHLAGCGRGLESLELSWPYLMAFSSCISISTGKPQQLYCIWCLLHVLLCFSSGLNFYKVERSLCRPVILRTFVRFETMIWTRGKTFWRIFSYPIGCKKKALCLEFILKNSKHGDTGLKLKLKVIPLFCTAHPLLRITLRHPRWRRLFPLARKEQKRARFCRSPS